MIGVLAVSAMVCALGPAALFCVNLGRYRAPRTVDASLPGISVLIPARDEEKSIEAAVRSVLAATGVDFEVIVMDDGSTDRTAEIVAQLAFEDSRVRLEHAPILPAGWNGKQHACWALANVARHDTMCFVDADVRLEPEALRRMAGSLSTNGNALVSGFPRQITGTWMEWMLLPLIHFVLLGFLPISRMRAGTDPAFAAGCGQFLMVRRDAYFACGGHSGIRLTMHDGLLLPRLFRAHGYRTDLADLTDLATCRMYTSAAQVWRGLAKNATEGIADPIRIAPISAVLLLGQVLPFVLLFQLGSVGWGVGICIVLSVAGAWLPHVLAVGRFRQDWRGALLHPLGILLLLAIQWYALGRKLSGGAVSWKTRAYVGE
ncbi:glycosyltransferase [Granulicella sibirica]|uniref:Glycosyltransferases involved in cell wall biogenesis n=1 Tax=Granulicella sibirica TaxID=2479048 RepID=A0A4Q0T2W7_9BACT|nr:glycosyltransferase family 2 protein [Granulicella sibirica]RXH56790.1 Glycosyltransferases involved in cell wall biogenesis [Granulicella sibirica]